MPTSSNWKKNAKIHAFKGKRTEFRQTPSQATVFPPYSLDFIDSVSSSWVIYLFHAGLCTSRIWGIIILVPLTWRHLYVTSHLYVYFFHHRRELQKTIKTREALLTDLRNCYAPPSSFEVNHLSQMHKRCKTGTLIFFAISW